MSKIWTFGLEYYKNDTGKEMDGTTLLKLESNSFEEAKANVQNLIRAWNLNATTLGSDKEFIAFVEREGGGTTFAHMFAMSFKASPTGMLNIYKIVNTNAYWFHLFDGEEMKKQRKTMFEQPDLLGELEPRGFEEIMEETTKAIDDNGTGLTFSESQYFNKTGDELPSIPDQWRVQIDAY